MRVQNGNALPGPACGYGFTMADDVTADRRIAQRLLAPRGQVKAQPGRAAQPLRAGLAESASWQNAPRAGCVALKQDDSRAWVLVA